MAKSLGFTVSKMPHFGFGATVLSPLDQLDHRVLPKLQYPIPCSWCIANSAVPYRTKKDSKVSIGAKSRGHLIRLTSQTRFHLLHHIQLRNRYLACPVHLVYHQD